MAYHFDYMHTSLKNNFDIYVEEICKEGLEWAYEPSVAMPIDLITSGIEKW